VTIRTLIVDDEPLARRRLRTLLDADPEVTVVGESGDGERALADVRTLRPDLMFLDVQMPILDGFGVLEALAEGPLPAVIFVTAHDRYALKAFEVHALDYLLKPFDRDRFAAALQRAKAQVRRGQSPAVDQQLRELLQAVQDRRQVAERLAVKSGGRVYLVRVEDIDWIEAASNYVRLHVGKEEHLLRDTLAGLESRLDPARFVRVHRSTIVNIDRIRELQPGFHGDHVIILRDGTELALSRSCREKLEASLGQAL
jgi:two-component system LytT family response regulator